MKEATRKAVDYMIPFIGKSRKGKAGAVSGCQGPRGRIVCRRVMGRFYKRCGDSYKIVYFCQNLLNCIRKIGELCCVLSLIKQIKNLRYNVIVRVNGKIHICSPKFSA